MSRIYERSLSSTIYYASRVLDYYWCASPLGIITQNMFDTVMSAVYDAQGVSAAHTAIMVAINHDPVLLKNFGVSSLNVAYTTGLNATASFWTVRRAAIISSDRPVGDEYPEAVSILRSVGGTLDTLKRAEERIVMFIEKRRVGRIDLWLHDWPELAALVDPRVMPKVMPKVVRKPKVTPEERVDMEWINPIIATAVLCMASGGHPKEYKI